MKQQAKRDSIIIDDDDLNNTICEKIIELTMPESVVQTFIDPNEGLQYILAKYPDMNAETTVLLLDINMLDISGWDILDRLEKIPDLANHHLKIYMLTSSVSPNDHEIAGAYSLVSGLISKPLSRAKLD